MNFSNISLVRNKILCILVFCNSAYFLWTHTFSYFLCAHSMLFGMKVHLLSFFCFALFFFCTSLISFCKHFTFFITIFNLFLLLKIFQPHQIPSVEFDPLLCVHRHAVSPVHFLHHVLRSFVSLLFFFLFIVLIWCPTVVSQHLSKNDKWVGWRDDRHGLSPILYDIAPLFVYTDQLLCHCVFICSNVR